MTTLVQPIAKERAWRSERYRRLVSSFPCAHCGLDGYTQAAHADLGKGGGIKADDRTCYPLCADRVGRHGCHTLMGATGHFTRPLRRRLELRYATETIARLRRLGLWANFKVDVPPWYEGKH